MDLYAEQRKGLFLRVEHNNELRFEEKQNRNKRNENTTRDAKAIRVGARYKGKLT
jgi:hypothetical protein